MKLHARKERIKKLFHCRLTKHYRKWCHLFDESVVVYSPFAWERTEKGSWRWIHYLQDVIFAFTLQGQRTLQNNTVMYNQSLTETRYQNNEQWIVSEKRSKLATLTSLGHCISPTPGTYFTPKHDPTSAREREETESKEVWEWVSKLALQ